MESFIDKELNIPTFKQHNHASNLLILANNSILCAWFGGSNEGRPDVSIFISKLTPNSLEWSDPIEVSSYSGRSEQNPVLFENPNGEIWLLYTSQIGIHQDTSIVYYTTSNDNGETWKEPSILFDTPGSFVRNPPLFLENNIILLPAYYSKKSNVGFLDNDYSVLKVSKNYGANWDEIKIPNSKGLVHMSLVKMKNEKLLAFFRSRLADNIYMTESIDKGNTWSTPVRTKLPNNNSSIQCIKLRDERLAMVFNNTNAKLNPIKENKPPWFNQEDVKTAIKDKSSNEGSIWGVIRSPLSISFSKDEGRSWSEAIDLQTSDNTLEKENKPEFSYPSIKQCNNGIVHITYTYLRKYIKHLQLGRI